MTNAFIIFFAFGGFTITDAIFPKVFNDFVIYHFSWLYPYLDTRLYLFGPTCRSSDYVLINL